MTQLLVVADSGRARILRVTSARPWSFAAVADIERAASRSGRRLEGAGPRGTGALATARASAHSDADAHAGELLRFAKRLVTRLDRERQAGRMDSLLLIVEPKFLGVLREHLSAATRRRVRWEHPRDLVRADDKRIAAALTRGGVIGEVTQLGRPLRAAS